MSAIMEQNEIAEKAGKASRSAIRAYRESVARGECDETILFNGRKLKIEWDKDRSVYLSRVQAAESLNVEIPRLQAIAAETSAAPGGSGSLCRFPRAGRYDRRRPTAENPRG